MVAKAPQQWRWQFTDRQYNTAFQFQLEVSLEHSGPVTWFNATNAMGMDRPNAGEAQVRFGRSQQTDGLFTDPTIHGETEVTFSESSLPGQPTFAADEITAAHPPLAAVLDAATQVSIIATDVNGIITLFNSGARNILGYESSEMVGKQTPEVLHVRSEVEERGQELSEEFGRRIGGFEVFVAYAREGRFERREWTYVRKDGCHLTVNLVVTAVKDAAGNICGFLGVAEDISERKHSERALRRSEERFDLAVAGSNEGIWDWDVRKGDVYYSPRFKELIGYCDSEFPDNFDSFESHLHPQDQRFTMEKIQRHLEHREPYDVEFRMRTRGGNYRWFRARGQAIWNSSGQAIRMAGSLTDINKRKKAEAALEKNAAEIQRANETLRQAEAEARKAVAKRDQFLAMLSHELRNPLSAVVNGLGVLEHADAELDAQRQAQQAIRRQIDHMSRLLDDLLDVARVTQGKIRFRTAIVDLNDLANEAAQAIQPAMDARGHRFSVLTSQHPLLVEGDSTRLLQVIENLLTNAAKYTPARGLISLELKSAAGFGELCVRDDGRGIDPDLLDEIFDMFFQSSNAIDRADGGMGVGLTLVRSLVELHGGTVQAHSEGLGRGACFLVRLPLASQRMQKNDGPTLLVTGNKTRVVLIEDNLDSREMLQTLLRLDGFDVVSAQDGQEGLALIMKQRPDVAVIDIGLPRLDGYEVARRVRQNEDNPGIRLVALTGYGQEQDREAVSQAGFDEHLVKPVNLDELKRVLNAPRKPR